MIEKVVSAITGTLTSFGTGVATFFNDFVKELVFTTEGELSAFASWGLAFLGLSLVLGLGAFIVGMVRSKH